MSRLSITLVQKEASLDPAENRAAVGTSAEQAVGSASEPTVGSASEPTVGSASGPELLVFPEVFMRDFGKAGSDISGFAEPLDGPYVERLAEVAAKHDLTVVAGMFERSNDPERPFNTLVVVDAGGLRTSYRKMHLYDSFGYKESDRLVAGPTEPVVVEVGGFQVGLMTCYDLRFPELGRALTDAGAELIVVPAAWVAGPGKVDHWRTLTKARAIENTVYVAAVGQPGPRYTGHSIVVSPMGETLAEVGDGEHLLHARVDHASLQEARETNPSLANRRL